MFDGVTDDEGEVTEYVRSNRSASKRSIRVRSAPIVIGEKQSPSPTRKKYQPTVVKPFKMTLR